MERPTNKELVEIIDDFRNGLLKKANCKHAGNCYAMSRMVQPYLSCFFDIDTMMVNYKVKQGRRRINHYCLMKPKGKDDFIIIDATASQFKYPNGETMPKVYIGKEPSFYEKYEQLSLQRTIKRIVENKTSTISAKK